MQIYIKIRLRLVKAEEHFIFSKFFEKFKLNSFFKGVCYISLKFQSPHSHAHGGKLVSAGEPDSK